MDTPTNILTDIRELVEYNYQDERRDFKAMTEAGELDDPEVHIFTNIQRIDAWLKDLGA